MKLYVTCSTSKRGSKYYALVLDLGYRKHFLSFDTSLCAEVLGISVEELYSAYDSGSTIELVNLSEAKT